MNTRYTGPTITAELGALPLNSALGRNPLALGRQIDVIDQIDGVPVEDLLEQFGSPLFVLSETTLRARADRMRKAFRSIHPRSEFGWSFKTNPLDAVCGVMKSEGWMAEVVSSYEYAKARRMGYEGREIIFNGPYKRRDTLETALREGALVQIDNWEELANIESVAAELGGVHNVGVRVQIATGYAPTWSKFGFPFASGEALQAALRVIRHPHLKLHTLHSHIGTYLLDPRAYSVATQVLLGLRELLREETGHLAECINLGGGFPSDSLLHGMVGPAAAVIPPIEAYAEAIASEIRRLPARQRPLLRLETGRHLCDNAGFLLARVVGRKNMATDAPGAAGGKVGYILDAGVNLHYTAAWFAIQAAPARSIDGALEPARLMGDLCMEIDVIREEVLLPRLQVGDALVMHPVGAYNFNQSMDFIHLRPAVVMIDPKGRAHPVRKREQIEDFAQLEQLPAHLAGK